MWLKLFSFFIFVMYNSFVFSQRQEIYLKNNWLFSHEDNIINSYVDFDDTSWEVVCVPHDWAIAGPFDKEFDKQVVAIEQNGETIASEKTGRSGALPWIGVGWYRKHVYIDGKFDRYFLNFDGAMSSPKVYINGKIAEEWKYGYTPFVIDITSFVIKNSDNVIAVRLENLPESSRWYPGAGLYRPVKLISTFSNSFKEWGINVETESINNNDYTADLKLEVDLLGEYKNRNIYLNITSSDFLDLNKEFIVKDNHIIKYNKVHNVEFWSPENPVLYDLELKLIEKDESGNIIITHDTKTVKFGIRNIKVSEEHGFTLNGNPRKIKGVCLHHDLGMLGAAINRAALCHQLVLLKTMGCDAIRTSHNIPSQWQMELCDSLGIMVMAESFDMWIYPKCKNGYSLYFKDWWKRDLENLVLANRLHPSIIMWSIGNEIPEQGMANGNELARKMQNWVHYLDKSRPVTAGMDRIDNALSTGYAQVLDIPGMNYRTNKYEMAYSKLRHGFLLGSETASTLSSRGVYKFPVELRKNYQYDDGQCSSYDVEYCWWSNLPEEDWVLQDDKEWVIGEFVWTGFDYLGEPTPYDEYWPSRSSYFGIFDLAGLPKDRYYLYRSHWNKQDQTIHLLPHWNWEGREGLITPVYCYTNYPTAELFVNGKSQGKISKKHTDEMNFNNNTELLDRYRLRWNNVVYEPGELKVIVYDEMGIQRGEEHVFTSGKPHHIELKADRSVITADGEDMAFITAYMVDKDGNFCPTADNLIDVSVYGNGVFKGICNGNPTSLESFTVPRMHFFNGMLSIGIMSTNDAGEITVVAHSTGVKDGLVNIYTK